MSEEIVENGRFLKATGITFISGVVTLLLSVGSSVILARVLGPEGRGVYTLALLLPALIVTLGNMGVGSAAVYYVARGEYRRQEILGNNVLLSLAIGGFGICIGLTIALYFREKLFPNVSLGILSLALVLVPLEMFFLAINNILLGVQRILEFNYVQVGQSFLLAVFVALALLGLKTGVTGAVLAGILSWVIIDIVVFILAKKQVGGVEISLNTRYLRRALLYGVQTHIANVLGFLNYRLDIFLINIYLGPTEVGLYAIAVGLVEKVWMISYAASTVLFPRVAAETEDERKKEFTPLVARAVLWTSTALVMVLAILGSWIVKVLFSDAFLPAVNALRPLLVGIVTLSVGRVLANDIAGRGYPRFNIYSGIVAVATNVVLNILWIPKYGIAGAAWASTVSYTVSFFIALFFHCRLSGNRWYKVIIPQSGDMDLFLTICKNFGRRIWKSSDSGNRNH